MPEDFVDFASTCQNHVTLVERFFAKKCAKSLMRKKIGADRVKNRSI